MATVFAWLVAQSLKVMLHLVTKKKLDLRYMVIAGGMPSAHSAFATALATSIAIQEGLQSPLFAISAAFATVVMFDAQGVRRAASIQARLLNQIIDELFQGHPISEARLRELIGHTPFEVFVGGALGVLLAWLWMRP